MSKLERVLLLTNEYPPHVYGGAGVHVEHLATALSRLTSVEVRCFGDQDFQDERLRVRGFGEPAALTTTADPQLARALEVFSRNLAMAGAPSQAQVVHTHTWYVAFAGHLLRTLHGTPLVATVHSLEPLRPWKADQLGPGYRLSSWAERLVLVNADAIIAVSEGTRRDILQHFDIDARKIHVVYNGIDPVVYRPVDTRHTLTRHGIDPTRPYVLFVGRITRQKGITHLVHAIPHLDPRLQVVLCAGEPDTEAIAREMEDGVAAARTLRPGIVWIREMLPRHEIVELYTHAAVFCCPSIYEPFGIINLEAMACETPVVASAVGGIPEVVVDGETGLLVDLHLTGSGAEPLDPHGFSRDLADSVNRVGLDPELGKRMGRNGRRRVEERFTWQAVAEDTLEIYQSILEAQQS